MLELESYHDVQNLWDNKIKETLNLEFKSEVTSNNNEIAKDISSFANSEGGVIIYGVEEDEQGLAQKSEGLQLTGQDERIQQIVSTTISPTLQIKINIINTPKQKSQKYFIIIKIPKSELYIHQVTTTGKFYIRNNTVVTPHKYDALTLKESEISLLYEKRFQNKKRLENSFNEKEKFLQEKIGGDTYFFIGAIPQTVTIQGEKITPSFYNRLICSKDGGSSISSDQFYYNWFSDHDFFFDNKPKGDGRISISHGQCLEMNDDGSMFYFKKVENNGFWEWWNYLYAIADFIHMVERFYSKRNFYGGISITCKFSYIFPLDNRGRVILSLDRHILSQDMNDKTTEHNPINELQISENIQSIPFNLEKIILSIFDKIFETLGMDDPQNQHSGFVTGLKNRITELRKINFED